MLTIGVYVSPLRASPAHGAYLRRWSFVHHPHLPQPTCSDLILAHTPGRLDSGQLVSDLRSLGWSSVSGRCRECKVSGHPPLGIPGSHPVVSGQAMYAHLTEMGAGHLKATISKKVLSTIHTNYRNIWNFRLKLAFPELSSKHKWIQLIYRPSDFIAYRP